MVGAYPIKEAYKNNSPKETRETFETEEEKNAKTKQTVLRVFTSIGLMVLAILIGYIFLWSYRKERTLMIVMLSIVIFIYSLIVMVFALVQRSKLDDIYFTLLIGGSAFMVILAILLIIIFSIIANRRMSQGYLGDQTRDYLNRSSEFSSLPPSPASISPEMPDSMPGSNPSNPY